MGTSNDWFENDSMWKRAYPFLFPEEKFAATEEGADRLIATLGVQPGDSVLDLCCGPGRVAVPLARRGIHVTAVDRTPLYLERLRERATAADVTIEIVREDMRRFRRDNAFDGVVNMFTSFGYFADKADDRRVLENIFASLKPGGRLIMEMMSREIAARVFQERDWAEKDGRFLIQEHRVDPDFGGTHDRWIIFDEDGRQDFEFSLRLYTGTELADLLRSVGFSEAQPFGAPDGRPYDNRANRLWMIARK